MSCIDSVIIMFLDGSQTWTAETTTNSTISFLYWSQQGLYDMNNSILEVWLTHFCNNTKSFDILWMFLKRGWHNLGLIFKHICKQSRCAGRPCVYFYTKSFCNYPNNIFKTRTLFSLLRDYQPFIPLFCLSL